MFDITSAILKARYQFYKKHKEIAPVEANDNLISQFAEDNIMSLELLNTWEIALNALENRLAKNTASDEAPPAVPPEPVLVQAEPEENLTDLSVEELRKIVKSQRTDFRPTLPVIYTAEKIRAMRAADLRHLQTKYGSDLLNARLRGEK